MVTELMFTFHTSMIHLRRFTFEISPIISVHYTAKKHTKRRIKTYVRTVTGEVVSQYHFLSEKDYKAMKKDKKKARKLLGLKEDEKLEDFSSSKHVYEESDTGELTKG